MEAKNHIGTTPLWLAAGYGHLEVAKFLIEQGGDINAVNSTEVWGGEGCWGGEGVWVWKKMVDFCVLKFCC